MHKDEKMLFWDEKKGFERFWGVVSGNFFDGKGYIGPDDGECGGNINIIAIHAPSRKSPIKIRTSEVLAFEILLVSREWTRFQLTLTNGRIAVITIPSVNDITNK